MPVAVQDEMELETAAADTPLPASKKARKPAAVAAAMAVRAWPNTLPEQMRAWPIC